MADIEKHIVYLAAMLKVFVGLIIAAMVVIFAGFVFVNARRSGVENRLDLRRYLNCGFDDQSCVPAAVESRADRTAYALHQVYKDLG
ncbi:MAG: hypothetical protein PVG70_14255 [Desulfobacterales bacterium]